MTTRKKLELIVTNGTDQSSFVLEQKPVLVGSLPNCQIQVPFPNQTIDQKICAVLQKEGDALVIRAFTKEFAIELNGKKYKSATLKDSIYFKLGFIDIILNVEEVQAPARVEPAAQLEALSELENFNDSLPSAFAIENEQMVSELSQRQEEIKHSLPEIPLEMPPQQKLGPEDKTDIAENPIEAQGPIEALPENPEEIESDERKELRRLEKALFSFNTVFDESGYIRKLSASYADSNLDFSGYIDPEDETVTKLPVDNFLEDKQAPAVHLTHMHNGTTLTDKFFELSQKKVFISNSHDKKAFFKVHDWSNTKNELIHNRNGKTVVVKLEGYRFQKANKHGALMNLSAPTTILEEGERVILSNETSQIVVQLEPMPPGLKKDSPLLFNEQLLKVMAAVWVLALVPVLTIMVAVDLPQRPKPKEEVVVILKRQQAPKKVASSSSSQAAPAEAKAEQAKAEPAQAKAPEKPTPKVEQKVAKSAPPKAVRAPKPTPKPTPAAKPVAKSAPAPKPVATAPAKQAPKTYSFNSASKMKSLLGSRLQGSANGSAQKVQVSVGSSIGSNQIRSVSSAGVGAVSNAVGKLATANGGASANLGASGLSGKTGTETSYAEGSAKVLGSIDPNLIRKIMREYIPQFRYCYQQELLTNEQVAGVFDLNFNINPSGRGINVNVASKGTGFSSSGLNCLRKVVSMISFPRPPGGNLVDVRQPLNFQQNRQAAGSY